MYIGISVLMIFRVLHLVFVKYVYFGFSFRNFILIFTIPKNLNDYF